MSKTNRLILGLLGVTGVLIVALLLSTSGSPRTSSQSSQPPKQPSLPQHIVASDGKTYNGRRIEIHVYNADLTRSECEALIAAYRERAKPNGQVSVRKPASDGSLWPWCIENFDGRGVFFNDSIFE